jgi:serine/threonine protein kinase
MENFDNLPSDPSVRVFRAIHRESNTWVEIKKIEYGNPGMRAQAEREAGILNEMHHPNIIALHEYFFEDGDRAMYIVTETTDRTLEQELMTAQKEGRRLDDATVQHYMRQITSAVAYCHGRGVVHRDIRPCNVMIMGDGSLKLSGFGLGWRMDGGAEWSGDVRFQAPEVVGKEEVSPACDVWSLGVLLYAMVLGWGPDERAGPLTPFQSQFEIVNDPAPPLQRCSAKIGLIFSAMLKKNPEDRPLAVEVETQLGGLRLPTLLWREPDLVHPRCWEVLDKLRVQWGGESGDHRLRDGQGR